MTAARPLTTIFSKRPLAGQVKTRLCPPLEPEQAAALALAMLDDTVERHLATRTYATELAVAPARSTAWFRARYADRLAVSAQVGSGLGERLENWFEARCAPGTTLVVVGSDCPSLGVGPVAEAHARLAAGRGPSAPSDPVDMVDMVDPVDPVDMVLAPDGGGGYSLVGLRRPVPGLFTEVRMSTGTMFEETLALARSRGLSVHLLDEYRDVDVAHDLERLDRELRGPTMAGALRTDPAFPARTFEWLQRNTERGS